MTALAITDFAHFTNGTDGYRADGFAVVIGDTLQSNVCQIVFGILNQPIY